MMDERFEKLARVLTGYSTELKKGERVLIDAFDIPTEMVVALIREVRRRGAEPLVNLHHAVISREIGLEVSESLLSIKARADLQVMKEVQAYIALRGSHNIYEASDIPSAQMKKISRITRPVLNWRVKKTKWVVLRWPTAAMAQQAQMSTESFTDFYFRVCTQDYARMQPGMEALRKLMAQTDRVHLKGPGTDLRFSIKGIGAVVCGGKRNIPDGEVFSCPVRNSVEGQVTYNAPTVYEGVSFDQVCLKFKKGKIMDATSNNTRRLNQILDADEGARYIGEFSLGFNPHILHPMRDILFDEKISGSFHFTPGQAYEEADNGNRSQIHWDMVCIQRKDYGGGEVWFDDKLIRKDGLFLPKALQKLNPDYLIGTGNKRPRKKRSAP